MNEYKMICLDIDGTLLNSKYEITHDTKETIKIAVNEKQIPVILVSARMPRGILFLQKELNVVQPVVCYSGALILNESNILLKIFIPSSDANAVYNIVKGMGIHISLYKDDEWYIEEMDEWARQESKITNVIPCITNFIDLLSEWEQMKAGPNKILCMGEPEEIKLLNSKLMECYSSHLNIYPSKPTYLEIMPDKATKTSAIEHLCQIFGVLKSEVIAIGDNYNDIDMIKHSGLGIAMGNAPDQVKQYADDVTLSNDEDGVAAAIKKYVL